MTVVHVIEFDTVRKQLQVSEKK